MQAAFRLRQRLPERERYSVEGAYYGGRNRAKAIDAFQHAVAVDSFNVDAFNSLAIMHSLSRNYAGAERAYRRAVALEPDNALVMVNLAGALIQSGRFAASDSVLRVVHERKLPYPTGRREIHLLYNRGLLDSVEALARTLMPNPSPMIGLGTVAYMRGVLEARGRLRESDSLTVEMERRNALRGEKASPLDRPLQLAIEDAWLRGQGTRAVARLDDLMRTHPVAGSVMGSSWKRADPELQGKVAEVRTRLDRLQRTLPR